MRVLVTTSGGAGHLVPLVPFIEAIGDAGSELLVTTRASMADSVRAAGLEVWPFDDAAAAERAPFFERAQSLSPDEANRLVVGEVFARLDAAAALPRIVEACEQWRPDLVLSESAEFAGPIAADLLGLARATVAIGLGSTEALLLETAAAALEEMRAARGLPRRAAATAPHLTLVPPLLEDPDAPPGPAVRRYREREATARGALPDWWDGDDRPLIYVTFGSVAPQMPFFPGVYRAAIDALADLPARVLVTIGRTRDAAELGELPANTHVEAWVPQADVMPHAAAMVCHGGFGTVRAALCAGVPQVLLPLFADQPYNARRAAAMGAGIMLEGGPAAVAGLGPAVRAVLSDPGYAERARRVADDVRRLPVVDVAVNLLQEVVQDDARALPPGYAGAR